MGINSLEAVVIKLKRAFEQPASSGGMCLLADGVWPRNVTRDALRAARGARDDNAVVLGECLGARARAGARGGGA